MADKIMCGFSRECDFSEECKFKLVSDVYLWPGNEQDLNPCITVLFDDDVFDYDLCKAGPGIYNVDVKLSSFLEVYLNNIENYGVENSNNVIKVLRHYADSIECSANEIIGGCVSIHGRKHINDDDVDIEIPSHWSPDKTITRELSVKFNCTTAAVSRFFSVCRKYNINTTSQLSKFSKHKFGSLTDSGRKTSRVAEMFLQLYGMEFKQHAFSNDLSQSNT